VRHLQITRKDTGGEWGVLFLAVATPPAGRDKSGSYSLAIAALGFHQQFATSIRKDGEPVKIAIAKHYKRVLCLYCLPQRLSRYFRLYM
jgi:hypothetical protein